MNDSLWINSAEGVRFPILDDDKRTDCLIVGGGIVGVTIAYLLSKKGVKVILVDADYVGYGASGRNTGKVTAQHNVIYSEIYKIYGSDGAKAYYEANKDAINLIEEIIDDNKIQCEYEKVPSYVFTQDEKESEKLLEEFNICKEIGIDCEYTMDCQLPIEIKGAIKFNIGGQFNPKKYIDAMTKVIIELGGEIYEKAPMKSLELEEDIVNVIGLNNYSIKAKKIMITSHFPFYDGLSFYFTRLKPERSYVVAAEYEENFPKATYINVEKPRRSFRTYDDGQRKYLLIGGESHKVAHKNELDYYEILKNYGKDIFNAEKYIFQWSSQDYIPPDGIPYIGYLNSIQDRIFVATGLAKWGMTNGTAAASVLSDLYLYGESKYSKIFSPSRTAGYYTKDFFKENIDLGFQYIKGKVRFATKELPEKYNAKVCIIEKKKYGVYRDGDCNLHIVDITCTHLGCELSWNPLECSWDCPCHGSRFGVDGEILEGPATLPLKQYGANSYNEINPNLL